MIDEGEMRHRLFHNRFPAWHGLAYEEIRTKIPRPLQSLFLHEDEEEACPKADASTRGRMPWQG